MNGVTRRELRPCAHCGKGLGHANGIFFYRLTIQRMYIDYRAVREHHGLELITGSPAIANVFASDNELAKPVSEGLKVLICDDCAMANLIIAGLEDMANEEAKERDQALLAAVARTEPDAGRYDGVIDLDDHHGEVPGA